MRLSQLGTGADYLQGRILLRSTCTPTVAQPVTVLQSRLPELCGAPSIYEGPDLLESTSVYELCSDSLGTQIALLPIQDPVRAVTAGTAPCRPLGSGHAGGCSTQKVLEGTV